MRTFSAELRRALAADATAADAIAADATAADATASDTAGSARSGLWLTFLPATGLELVDLTGVDWVCADLQHGTLGVTDLADLMRATDLPFLARVASHDPAHLGAVLDTGVDGVIVPTVDSAEQAEALVRAAYPPPRGRRSLGLSRSAVLGHEAPPLLLPMVETADGLAAHREIAAVEGIDGIFVGPYDLALSLGAQGVRTDQVIAAVTEVCRAVDELGKISGCFSGDPALTPLLPRVSLLAVETDLGCLGAGVGARFGG